MKGVGEHFASADELIAFYDANLFRSEVKSKKKAGPPQADIDCKRDTMHKIMTALAKEAGVDVHPDDDDK